LCFYEYDIVSLNNQIPRQMKKLVTLILFCGIVLSQVVAQSQLTVDPYSTVQQLSIVSFKKKATDDYYACGFLPVGTTFGMISRLTNHQVIWNQAFQSLSSVEAITSIISGDVVVSGTNNLVNAFIARVDKENGNLVWFTSLSTSALQYTTDVAKNSMGHVYVTIINDNQQEFLAKVSSDDGTIIWKRTPSTSSGIQPRLQTTGDSLLLADGPSSGDVSIRILDASDVEVFRRTYGAPGTIEDLTSFIKIPSGYALATRRTVSGIGRIGVILLDQNFSITASKSYRALAGDLENGKLLYDSGNLYLSGDKVQSETYRAFAMKLNTDLSINWTKALSSANSLIACEPFMDGSLRVPMTRFPTINGSERGFVLNSLDPVTGNSTGTACENPAAFTVVAEVYSGLTQANQSVSTWSDLSVIPVPSYVYGGYPLVLEDCEPGTLVNPLHLRAFLEGPYDASTGLMYDSLRTWGIIPTTDPYGFNQSANPAVFAVSGNDAIVDWVKIQIRDPLMPHTVVDSLPAFIERDGDIVGIDGVSSPITNVPGGSYYLSVLHRNHLGVCTATAVATSSIVDFTSLSTATYGANAEKVVNGVMTMWAGDAKANRNVQYTGNGNDRDPILGSVGGTTPNNISFGLYGGVDVNMDARFQYTGVGNDRDRILVNIGSTTPNNIRVAQLP
jgi:hypothetical protein